MDEPLARRLLARLPPPGEPVAPTFDPSDLASATAALGEPAVAWALVVSRRGFEAVRDEIPDERPESFFAVLARAIERSALEFLFVLDGRDDEFALNPEQLMVVEVLARDGIPFDRIVRGLRIVQSHWTRIFLDLAENHRPVRERTPLVRELTEQMTRFFDRTVDAVITEYLAERQRLMAQRIGTQRDLVSALLDGRATDVAAAGRTLGVDLARHHLALLVWLDDPHKLSRVDHGEHGYLERVARRVCDVLRCPTPLVTGADDATLWAWASRSRPFAERDLAALRALRADPGVRIAAGQPGRGVDGFRRSHLAARDACRVCRTLRLPEPVVAYPDVALASLLTNDLERARWFVTEELGPLAADDAAVAELRRTLLAYLDQGGSLVKTAQHLHIHRNTVVYRLRKIEDLLGRAVHRRTLETHTALRLAGIEGGVSPSAARCDSLSRTV